MGPGNWVLGAIQLLRGRKLPIKGKITFRRIYNHFFRPENAAQASLYRKLKPYNFFDEAWYRLAYKDQIEFPDDLLLDYIKAGIQNERDPSPYFNTTLYRREHDVPAEKALLHYLRGGQAVDAGAYRNEHAFLSTQREYRMRTETHLNRDYRSSRLPFAVFLQCGEGSHWKDWQPAIDRSWHLLVNHYDTTNVGRLPSDVEFQQTGVYPGTKFTAFQSILENYPHIIAPYEYILLLDDDVQLEDGAVNGLFSVVEQHGWELAQASLSRESSSSFPVFFNSGTHGWRVVNGVELMMPVYSRRALGLVRQVISQSVSGWGFDAALSVLANQQGFHAAVVDDVVAVHRRAINADIGKYYQMLHQAQIYPEIEFTHLQKKYGFTKPLFYEISPS
jgi:hypothetical protein